MSFILINNKLEISKINKLINQDFKVLGFIDSFKGSRTKCIVKCSIHGYGSSFGTPWIPAYSNIMKGSGCPKCKGCYIETESEALYNLKNTLKDKKIKILGFKNKYNGKKTKCEVQCDIHGNGSDWGTPWNPHYETLKRGFGCPKCANQYKKSEKEALSYMNETLKNKPIKIVGFSERYRGNLTRCVVTCEIHGKGCEWKNPWNPVYSELKNKDNCVKCSGNYDKTEDEVLNEINDLLKEKKIKVLEFKNKYKSVSTKCIMECDIHGKGIEWGNPWIPNVMYLKAGSGCPKCANLYSETKEEALLNLKSLLKNKDLKIIGFKGIFQNNKTKCIIKCNIHGKGTDFKNPWTPTYKDLKNLKGCPKCAKNYMETKDEAIDNLNLFLKNKPINFIGFNGKYKYSKTECLMECDIHGKGELFDIPWYSNISKIKSGKGCPKCAIERNELSNCLKSPKQFKYNRFLYFVIFRNLNNDKVFYKIGISNNGVNKRFRESELKKDNVKILDYQAVKTNNINALIAEYWALRFFNDKRKYMLHILKNCGGGTECFSEDITKTLSLKEIVKQSDKNFNNILEDFDLSQTEKYKADFYFKELKK